jgi:hypothetical protein
VLALWNRLIADANRPPIHGLTGTEIQYVAEDAGGVDMLEHNYSFAIEDLEDEGPNPAVEERIPARQLALADRRRRPRVA